MANGRHPLNRSHHINADRWIRARRAAKEFSHVHNTPFTVPFKQQQSHEAGEGRHALTTPFQVFVFHFLLIFSRCSLSFARHAKSLRRGKQFSFTIIASFSNFTRAPCNRLKNCFAPANSISFWCMQFPTSFTSSYYPRAVLPMLYCLLKALGRPNSGISIILTGSLSLSLSPE